MPKYPQSHTKLQSCSYIIMRKFSIRSELEQDPASCALDISVLMSHKVSKGYLGSIK